MVAAIAKTRKSEVSPIARIFVKRTSAVVYKYSPSDGGMSYNTTVINGKATGCTCIGNSKFHKTCKHMIDAVSRESERQQATTQTIETVAARRSTTPVDLTVVRQFKREDAYEQLAEAKDPWAGLSEDERVTAMGYYLMGIGA